MKILKSVNMVEGQTGVHVAQELYWSARSTVI